MIDGKWTLAIVIIVLLSVCANGRRAFHQPVPSPGVLTFRATSRADSCTHQGRQHQCVFILYCVLSGGTSVGSCSNGFLSSCCVYPTTRRTTSVRSSRPQSSQQQRVQRTGYTDKKECGISAVKPQTRIVGGRDAYFGEFPWQAHIKVDRQQCGGVLLNPYFVLTAAHCVYQIKLRDISVVLGVYDIQDQTRQQEQPQTFDVVEKRIHPNFRFSAAHPDRYDVALLRLRSPVKYQKHISPICLPPRGWDFKGWRATITGWGKTDTSIVNRYGTRLLQKVKVPIIGNEECEYWHRSRGIDLKIYHEMTCAGYESGEKDACVGDSGGPMMIKLDGKWTLVGIISAGFGCAQSRQPGIYHRVSKTVDWIQSNLNG